MRFHCSSVKRSFYTINIGPIITVRTLDFAMLLAGLMGATACVAGSAELTLGHDHGKRWSIGGRGGWHYLDNALPYMKDVSRTVCSAPTRPVPQRAALPLNSDQLLQVLEQFRNVPFVTLVIGPRSDALGRDQLGPLQDRQVL